MQSFVQTFIKKIDVLESYVYPEEYQRHENIDKIECLCLSSLQVHTRKSRLNCFDTGLRGTPDIDGFSYQRAGLVGSLAYLFTKFKIVSWYELFYGYALLAQNRSILFSLQLWVNGHNLWFTNREQT